MNDDISLLHRKITVELNAGRGVRIGESSIASTKLHMFDREKSKAIIIRNKDIGRCRFKQNIPNCFVHLDTYHSFGQVDCVKIIDNLKILFQSDSLVIVKTYCGTGCMDGGLTQITYENNDLFSNHVHTVIRISPAKYDLIIPAVFAIEQSILSDNLVLKKIKSCKSRRFWFVRSIFKSNSPNRLLEGEGLSLSVKRVRGCSGTVSCGGISGGITGGDSGKADINKDISAIADMLKKNISFKKEKVNRDTSGIYKRMVSYEKDDWIEEIAVSETLASLVKDYYGHNGGGARENSIKVYKRYEKDYRNTIFIIDNSMSMRGKNIESVKGAVIDICKRLKGEVAIVIFASKTAYLYSRFTNNKEKIKKLVDSINDDEMTPLAHALSIAYEYGIKSLKKDINLIVLTDGEPNVPLMSDNPLADCIEISRKIGRKGFNLCCISTTIEAEDLSKIAEAAKGRSYCLESFERQQLYNIMNRELK